MIHDPRSDVYPVFAFKGRAQGQVPEAVLGTGFLAGPGCFVTCWHVVKGAVETGLNVALVAEKPSGGKIGIDLDVIQDERGIDLASSRIAGVPRYGYSVGAPARYGERVWAFGYPLTEVPTEENPAYVVAGRYLEGYIVREAIAGDLPYYELDMRAPEGMSGAPLCRVGTRELVGVLHGVKRTEMIEEFARVDDEGTRHPEQLRVESFAVAHTVEVLATHCTGATNGRPLIDWIRPSPVSLPAAPPSPGVSTRAPTEKPRGIDA
jgi:hypothetical protein